MVLGEGVGACVWVCGGGVIGECLVVVDVGGGLGIFADEGGAESSVGGGFCGGVAGVGEG